MRSEPHPSSTAEKSRFSMIAVTAIHQRLANAVAKVGAMVEGGKELQAEKSEAPGETDGGRGREEKSKLEVQREPPGLTLGMEEL